MARCFVGVMIPEFSKSQIENLKDDLKKNGVEGKYVERDNSHISLSFLGEKDEEEIQGINVKLDELTKSFSKIDVTLCGLKLIPNENFIRVIATNVQDETGKINELGKAIASRIGGDSKPPHLTLCRVSQVKNKEVLKQDVEKYANACFAGFIVDKVQLIKSELSRSGPIYSVIHESPLGP